MKVARDAQFTGHLHNERNKHDIQEDVDTMKKAVEWLEGIEADLLSTNAARNRQARSPQPRQQQ